MKRQTKLTTIQVTTDTQFASAVKLIRQVLLDAICKDITRATKLNQERQARWAIKKYRKMGKLPQEEARAIRRLEATRKGQEAIALYQELGTWRKVGERLGIKTRAAESRAKYFKGLPTYQTLTKKGGSNG